MRYLIDNNEIWSVVEKESYKGHYYPIINCYEKASKLNKIVYEFPNFTFVGEVNELFKISELLGVVINVEGYVYYKGNYLEICKENKFKLYDFIIHDFYSNEPNKELLVNIVKQLKLWI